MRTAEGAERATEGGGLVDLAKARGIAGDCGWSLAELAHFYLDGTLAQVEHIRQELEEGRDGETVRRLAHGCAGSSLTSGVPGMAEIFRRIEDAEKSETLKVAAALLPEIRERLAEAERILAAAAAPPPPAPESD